MGPADNAQSLYFPSESEETTSPGSVPRGCTFTVTGGCWHDGKAWWVSLLRPRARGEGMGSVPHGVRLKWSSVSDAQGAGASSRQRQEAGGPVPDSCPLSQQISPFTSSSLYVSPAQPTSLGWGLGSHWVEMQGETTRTPPASPGWSTPDAGNSVQVRWDSATSSGPPGPPRPPGSPQLPWQPQARPGLISQRRS